MTDRATEFIGPEDLTFNPLPAVEGFARAAAAFRTSDGDRVNHPAHYNAHPSGVECLDIVRWMNFNLGNAVKYIWRAGLKSADPIEDLRKAAFYLEDEIKRLQGDKHVQAV